MTAGDPADPARRRYTYQDVWRWEIAEQFAAASCQSVAETMALTHDGTVQTGEIIDERQPVTPTPKEDQSCKHGWATRRP